MPPLHVGLLLYAGCLPAGLLAAADVLQAANLRCGREAFRLHWLGPKKGMVQAAHGVRLRAEQALDDADCRVILVPGFWAHSTHGLDDTVARHAELVASMRRRGAGVRWWAYCTGVTLLAATGRLRGEPATSTWWLAPWLEQRHPQVAWQWQHGVAAGRHAVTASGTHGYQPILALEVQRLLDAELWRDVERFAVLPRPQASLPVFDRLDMASSSDALLRRLRALVEQRPASDTGIATLAQALATSPRTLARKVQAAAGQSVGEHVRLLKLRQAGERLLHAERAVGQISDALGFADESSFRRSFKRATGLTPAAFRARYRTG